MQLIIQGMRRSGTTILFDLFWGLSGVKCFYEPLARMEKPALGGGSGEREVDLFEPVRAARQDFVDRGNFGLSFDDLNVGAPTAPWLEISDEGPEGLESYLEFLGQQGNPDVVMKFTRLAAKVPVAHRALPNAYFLHIVRDPRRVTQSHLFGRDGKRAHKYATVDDFFNKCVRRLPWSATASSDGVVARMGYPSNAVFTDVERMLLLWGFNFRQTHDFGNRLFGNRYRLIRHEELTDEPLSTVKRIWGWLGREVPESVVGWVRDHVKGPEEAFAGEDRRWQEAVRRLGLSEEVSEAGYGELAAGPVRQE